jgi:hypothetical protein
VRIRVSCPVEPCRATVSGRVRVPKIGSRPSRLLKLSTATAAIGQGATVTLQARLSSTARRALKRALRERRGIVAQLTITALDAAQNKAILMRRVRLKL